MSQSATFSGQETQTNRPTNQQTNRPTAVCIPTTPRPAESFLTCPSFLLPSFFLLCVVCVLCVIPYTCCASSDEENELHHQESEIELQRQRKRDEYHSWQGEKVNFDEEIVYPRLLKLQEENHAKVIQKRKLELKLIRQAKEDAAAEVAAKALRLENRELLERAKNWFVNSGITRIFRAWKTLVKFNRHLRATARCNGRESSGGCCCWHCWPCSCRCCCCKLPQPGKKKVKLKLKRIKRKKNRVADYKTGAGKN